MKQFTYGSLRIQRYENENNFKYGFIANNALLKIAFFLLLK